MTDAAADRDGAPGAVNNRRSQPQSLLTPCTPTQQPCLVKAAHPAPCSTPSPDAPRETSRTHPQHTCSRALHTHTHHRRLPVCALPPAAARQHATTVACARQLQPRKAASAAPVADAHATAEASAGILSPARATAAAAAPGSAAAPASAPAPAAPACRTAGSCSHERCTQRVQQAAARVSRGRHGGWHSCGCRAPNAQARPARAKECTRQQTRRPLALPRAAQRAAPHPCVAA